MRCNRKCAKFLGRERDKIELLYTFIFRKFDHYELPSFGWRCNNKMKTYVEQSAPFQLMSYYTYLHFSVKWLQHFFCSRTDPIKRSLLFPPHWIRPKLKVDSSKFSLSRIELQMCNIEVERLTLLHSILTSLFLWLICMPFWMLL